MGQKLNGNHNVYYPGITTRQRQHTAYKMKKKQKQNSARIEKGSF